MESTGINGSSTHTLRAFCNDSARPQVQGNHCTVSLLQSPPPPGAAPDAGGAGQSSTHCFTWLSGARQAQVRCWNNSGQPIQCCGHGLLSCAAIWIQQWGKSGSLTMGGAAIPCHNENGKTWLGFARSASRVCPVPDWLESTLGVAPAACASAGGEDGYLVVQLHPDNAIETVVTPGADLATHTRRALIVTRSDCHAGEEDAHIQLRYFAPQYGESEDAATGSAMRILADYWHHQGLGARLVAHQASAPGGLLFSILQENVAWIGGNVVQLKTQKDSA